MGVHLVVAGSDTGVGKTHVTRRLLQALASHGERVAAFKPLESGCSPGPDGTLLPLDALALQQAAGDWQPLDVVCPWPLVPPLAPADVLERLGRTVTESELVDAASRARSDASLLVCETAGGLRSPLTRALTSIDMARVLDAHVLLVVRDRLGAIHQATICLDVLAARGIPVLALVLNRVDGDEAPFGDANALWIERAHPGVPIYCVGADDPLYSLRDRVLTLVGARIA